MVSVNKLENYANDIRRITFKNGGSLTVKIYPTYNPSVAKTYKFTCGCTSHTYGSAVITKQPTCTIRGYKTKTCTQCGATVTETIARLHTNMLPQLLHLLALLTATHSTSVLFAVLHTRTAQQKHRSQLRKFCCNKTADLHSRRYKNKDLHKVQCDSYRNYSKDFTQICRHRYCTYLHY